MVNPTHGSSPISWGNSYPTPPPSPQLYNVMTCLWCLFSQGEHSSGSWTEPSQYGNNLAFFTQFKEAVAPFLSYCENASNQPLDPFTNQIFLDLKTVTNASGFSLAWFCQSNIATGWIAWSSYFDAQGAPGGNSIAQQLDVIFNDVAYKGITINGQSYGNWFAMEYPSGSQEPSPTPPPNLQEDYQQLLIDLKTWQNDALGSSQYMADGDKVANDILAIYQDLSAASSMGQLDGYGQFLANFLNAPFVPSTTDPNGISLLDIAQSISENGISTNPSMGIALWTAMYDSIGGNPPMYDSFTGWINDILNKYEW